MKIVLRKGFLSIQLLYYTKGSRKIQISDDKWWYINFERGLENIFLIFLPNIVKQCTVLHDVQNVPPNYFVIFLNLTIFYPMTWSRSITPHKKYRYICSLLRVFACQCSQEHIFFICVYIMYMNGSRSCGCLVAWLCYQLARPGGGTAAPPWLDPCAYVRGCT